MRRSLIRNISILALVGMGILIYKAWQQTKRPPSLPPSHAIAVDEVKLCPCYTRITLPSEAQLLSNLNRVVSITDRLTGAYVSARSNTLLLRFPHFKAVIFPEIAEIVEQEGKLPFLKKGSLITVRGLLIAHPKYGVEIIVKRPQDLIVGTTA